MTAPPADIELNGIMVLSGTAMVLIHCTSTEEYNRLSVLPIEADMAQIHVPDWSVIPIHIPVFASVTDFLEVTP